MADIELRCFNSIECEYELVSPQCESLHLRAHVTRTSVTQPGQGGRVVSSVAGITP